MASKNRLRELGKLLNIQTVAHKKYELAEQDIPNLDFLQFVFERELQVRKQNAVRRNRKNANLPQVMLDKARLHEGLLYQLKKLEQCEWIEKSENLLLVGKSNSHKTAIAVHLVNSALDRGYKVIYLAVDELFILLENKDKTQKANLVHSRLMSADVVALDDFLYLDLDKEKLELLYKTLMTLTGSTSIIFVVNRDPLEWVESAADKYTMQLLINRTIATCEKILT